MQKSFFLLIMLIFIPLNITVVLAHPSEDLWRVYQMENKDGATIIDAINNINASTALQGGAPQNDLQFEPGQNNNQSFFTGGASSHVWLQDRPSWNTPDNFTMSFWANYSRSTQDIFFSIVQDAAFIRRTMWNATTIQITQSGTTCDGLSSNVLINLSSGIVLNNSLPNFFSFVWDGTGGREYIYINGILQDSIPWTTSGCTGTQIAIGQSIANTSANAYSGGMDEIYFWQRNLSQQEITDLYSGGNGYFWPFTNVSHNFSIALNEPSAGATITGNNITVGLNTTITGTNASYFTTLLINGTENQTALILNNSKYEFNVTFNVSGQYLWQVNASVTESGNVTHNSSSTRTFTISRTGINLETFNLTSAISGEFNYTFVFNFSPGTTTADECWILANGARYNATLLDGFCNVSVAFRQGLEVFARPEGNDTSGTGFFGTNTTLVRRYRQNIYQNTSLNSNSNLSLQFLLQEFRLENLINQTHTSISFQHNTTAETRTITLEPLTNTSTNTTYDIDILLESVIVSLDQLSTFTINTSAYNFSRNLSINSSITQFATSRINITHLLAGLLSNVFLTNSSNTKNFTLAGNTITYVLDSASANMTRNHTLNWTSQVSFLITDTLATNTCLDSTIREYTKEDTIEVYIPQGTHTRTFDITGGLTPNLNEAASNNLTITNPEEITISSTRLITGTDYQLNMSPNVTGNHTIRIQYTFTDNTCLISPPTSGGGGGGGGDTFLTVVQSGVVNLSLRPSFFEGFIIFEKSNYVSRANKVVLSCSPKKQLSKEINLSCVLLDNTTVLMNVNLSTKLFTLPILAEFEITSENGEKSVVKIQKTYINFGYALSLRPGILPRIPFFVSVNSQGLSDGIKIFPSMILLFLLGISVFFIYVSFKPRFI